MIERVQDQAANKWHSILINLGMDADILINRHTDCPICQRVKKFRFDDTGAGNWICVCGAGDGVSLAMEFLGLNFIDAVKEIRDVLGISTEKVYKKVDDLQEQKKNKQRLGNIKKSFVAIARGSVVAQYFNSRGVKVSQAQNIAHGKAPYYEDGTKTGVFDVVAATVSDINGRAATLHLTYLDDAGKKLDVESPKKVMPKVSDWSGGAIRLFPVKDDGVLAIAEGVETALAVQNSEGIPCWAVINANNLSRFKVPSYVKHLLIYADSDKSFTGQLAAYLLAKSIKDECRKSGSDLEVKVILLHENNGIKEIIDSGIDKDYLDFYTESTVKDKKEI